MAIAKGTTLSLTNKSNDNLYIDAAKISATKQQIKTDLSAIITDLTNIKNAYKTLANHKDTKGSWKTTANSCVKKCTTYITNLSNDKKTLESTIDSNVQDYVLTMIAELQKAQQAAESIKTNI